MLLTVFRKTRRAETREAERAIQVQRTCATEHDVAHEIYEREES